MKQVVQSARGGGLSLKEVPEPLVTDGHLLVRTRASLISSGTDRLVTGFANKSLVAKAASRPDLVKKVVATARRDGVAAALRAAFARLDEPLPLGYSAAGVVEAVGAGLEAKFRVGQRVAIAGAGLANHAEINLVPGNLAAPVPDDANDEEACFGTLAAIALHAVRNLGLSLGESAAVIGCGLVGQLAVRLLELSGVRAVALDYDAARLELARYGGAELALNLGEGDPSGAIIATTGGLGCDGVLIAAATDSSEPFELAARIARDRARVCLVGLTGTEFPYRDYMQKELSIIVSRSYGPGRYDADYEQRGMSYPPGYVRWTETANLAEAVRLMSRKSDRRLAVEPLISHRFAFDKAEDAYALVTGKTEPHLGVVLRYAEAPKRDGVVRLRVPAHVATAAKIGTCVVGLIGAGNFARIEILPRLKAMSGVTLKTVVTRRGTSGEHAREKFGFEQASTDVETVFGDPAINAVIIATPHSTHADLTARALIAGKNVYVEKPLALSRDEVNRVIEARNGSAGFFQVGFNRRAAPLAIEMHNMLVNARGAKSIFIRVNAGALPKESWLTSEQEGGGRILGEMCHFVDLARFLMMQPIEQVMAIATRTQSAICEDVSATLSFADGSLATIMYTTLGDTSFSKELIEAYAGGKVMVIDDFRRGAGAQDKGHANALQRFVDGVRKGRAPFPEDELVETSLATIAVRESLRSGAPVTL
jgi:predicted dehydrogenase/threonine dehydrogenase-like Zn-dependent dehydrogenase